MTGAEQREFKSCLALRHTPGLGPRSWRLLLDHFGSAWEALGQAAAWSGLGLAREGAGQACRARAWEQEARAEFDAARRLGMGVLLHSDPAYPEALRQIPGPPLFLYHAGRPELAAGPCVAVVGTRRCSAEAARRAERLAAGLSEAGITVVSGLAQGVDRSAHQGGLAGPGSTVAVLGCGLDVVFPPANAGLREEVAGRGLLLTEFAPGMEPRAANFPQRNRIVSGLSLGVVVVEAPAGSGALITARLALEQGREVYVLEGPPDSPGYAGSRELLADGAMRVASAGEVILDLAPQLKAGLAGRIPAPAPARARPRSSPPPVRPPPPPTPSLPPLAGDTAEECAALAALGAGARHVDELTRALGWEAARTGRVLLEMELKGLVRQLPGMRYAVGR